MSKKPLLAVMASRGLFMKQTGGFYNRKNSVIQYLAPLHRILIFTTPFTTLSHY